MFSSNGSRTGNESREVQVTATKLSPSDIGSVIDLFEQIGMDPYHETPRALDEEQSVDEDKSTPRTEEEVSRECAASIKGIQTQMLVELTLITHAVEEIFPGDKLMLNGELSGLISRFYRNQTEWKRKLFESIFPKAIAGRVFLYSEEDLENMDDPGFDEFFGYVGESSTAPEDSVLRAFHELRRKFLFHNYNRMHNLTPPYEGSVLSAAQVQDIWYQMFDDQGVEQISRSVFALLNNEILQDPNVELSRILSATDPSTITFEPVTIQQLCMRHPDPNIQHSFIMHLSAMTDILIPSQQVQRANFGGLYITPPIMIDIKTGRQMFDPNEIREKDQIETLAYILAGAKSRIALNPKANGTGIGQKANGIEVQAELNSIAMNPWHYCRLYHFNPLTGEAQNLMPFIFLPERVRDIYVSEGKRVPLTADEQQEMYRKLRAAYEKLVILSDWIRLNKRSKPWKQTKEEPEYIMPKLMKPGHQYEVPLAIPN
jgi:hypothetical protein